MKQARLGRTVSSRKKQGRIFLRERKEKNGHGGKRVEVVIVDEFYFYSAVEGQATC